MSALHTPSTVSTVATASPAQPAGAVELLASEVLGGGVVTCPNPKMTLWSGHPKVFVNVGKTGSGSCPYCGTVYRLKAGEHLHGH
jgi:uncharacterized Zn-finger protein